MDFPHPEPNDTDEVAWAIQTAHTSWKRGDVADAMRWLQRAAEAAEEAGDDMRLLVLARAATEFAQGPKPKPAASPQPAREMPRPPPPPRASKPPRHQTVIGLGAPQDSDIVAATRAHQQRPPPPSSRTPGPPPVSRTPSPPPPVTRSSRPPTLADELRDSDPDFEQVTRVYDSGQLRAATADTRPTSPPPPAHTPLPAAGRTAAQTPLATGRTSMAATQTPNPAARTATSAARTPAAPAVTSRAPTPQTTTKQAGSIAPAAIKPVGASERAQPRKSATHRAVRVSVARLPDHATLTVRQLAEGERAPIGTREALLVPLHPDEDFFG